MIRLPSLVSAFALFFCLLLVGCSEAPQNTKQSVVANPPDIPTPPAEEAQQPSQEVEPETSTEDDTSAGLDPQTPEPGSAQNEESDNEAESTEDPPEPEN